MPVRLAMLTTSRADLGYFLPLINQIHRRPKEFQLELLIGGYHEVFPEKLAEFQECSNITMVYEGLYDARMTRSQIMDNVQRLTRKHLSLSQASWFLLVGDRLEILSPALESLLQRIPIVHIGGGEITEGAFDDEIRNSLTKLSHIHFPFHEKAASRIVQMGEDPARVRNFGTPFADYIKKASLPSLENVCSKVGVNAAIPYLLVTLHPETKGVADPQQRYWNQSQSLFEALLEILNQNQNLQLLFTQPNHDIDGLEVQSAMKIFCRETDRCYFIENAGHDEYLTLLRHASIVVGNSSSGVLEAPYLRVPTVNIGKRQSGRPVSRSIKSVSFDFHEIVEAIHDVLNKSRAEITFDLHYGDGKAAENMLNFVANQESQDSLLKVFWEA
jgi:UDP-hydrolysing UDP-N-acetyl-D-glucosamine 2-epimerase